MTEFWRGSAYDQHRLLLLGESAYSWMEDGEVVHPSPRHSATLVEEVLDGHNMGPFMSKLTRGLAACHNPTTEQTAVAWSRAALTNYIPGTVGLGARLRPSPEQWYEAALAFRSLLADIAPRNIIVLGKSMWSRMPDADVWLIDDVQAYRLPNGRYAMCWAVPHPAAGLSWDRLARLIAFAERREVLETLL